MPHAVKTVKAQRQQHTHTFPHGTLKNDKVAAVKKIDKARKI
jgi:hypothetical protein